MRLDPQMARRAARYGLAGTFALGLAGGVLVTAPAFYIAALELTVVGVMCLVFAVIALDEAKRP